MLESRTVQGILETRDKVAQIAFLGIHDILTLRVVIRKLIVTCIPVSIGRDTGKIFVWTQILNFVDLKM